MNDMPHESLSELRIRNLGNQEIKKIAEMLVFHCISSIQSATQMTIFHICATKCGKIAVKHLYQKPISIDFVSTIFCPRLSLSGIGK